MSFMADLLHERTLNARQFCVAMHFAAEAGIQEARKFAMKPNAQSGKYSAHLKRVNVSVEDHCRFYSLPVPSTRKQDHARVVMAIPVLPPHELLAEELADPSTRVRVAEYVASGMPPAYIEHRYVQNKSPEAPAGVVAPCAVYVGAVPYSLTDSVLGF